MSEREYRKVEGNTDLSRDMSSGVIVNTNRNAYERAVARSTAAQRHRDELRSVTRDINNSFKLCN